MSSTTLRRREGRRAPVAEIGSPKDEAHADQREQNQRYPAGQRVVDSLQHGRRPVAKTIKGQFAIRPVRRAHRPETNLSLDLSYVAEWTGLEPATPGVTGRYSNQLNYRSDLVGAEGIEPPTFAL